MKLVFFTHPPFLKMASMMRYASWLAEGMAQRGHEVHTWAPEPRFYRLPVPARFRKWMGYIDQFLVFPRQIRHRMARESDDTLYVFADHALGPWVPSVASRPNVVHCHDFLAQDSALGLIPQNPVSSTGRIYQRYIRHGFQHARAFIAISQKTREDLLAVIGPDGRCEVVYNGVNPRFRPSADVPADRAALGRKLGLDLSRGYVLHVGVNTWYKNRRGVLVGYDAWRRRAAAAGDETALPLLMVGPPPPDELAALQATLPSARDIHFLTDVTDEALVSLYGAATVFLFPSIAEGFGWPIAEAMASGCPVVTTGIAPMTEVAGDAAFLIPPDAGERADVDSPWAGEVAAKLAEVIGLPDADRAAVVARGLAQVAHFDSTKALDRIEGIYAKLLAERRPS
ncbi:MAG: glycosyltransferase family 1 protein [Variovorax sp.]|jgi:glycosyltransferase involved in cell wall biosynthesis|nr:MAG: glycosyltransferase family 1 protein [Variovorax sp.]